MQSMRRQLRLSTANDLILRDERSLHRLRTLGRRVRGVIQADLTSKD